MSYKEIDIVNENVNPLKAIGKDWMLITAGTKEKFNTMTASWGGMGVMWNKNMVLCGIRPQRYTKEFIENEDYFSICFFNGECKDAMAICGKLSGRDCDKIKEAKLTPVFLDDVPAFEEASLILICRKIYRQPLEESCFIDKANFEKWYNNDLHIMYGGEIIKAYKKD